MNIFSKAIKTIFSPLRRMASVYGYVSNYYPYANQIELAEQIRHYRNWVYIAINALQQRIAQQVPVVAYKVHKSKVHNKAFRLDRIARSKALTHAHAFEDIEVANNHKLAKLLAKPNDVDTSADLWKETVLFHELTGNCYWWTPLDDDGEPYEIWVIPAHWVRPIVGDKALISHYEVRPYEAVSSVIELPADEVIHFRNPSPYSKILGYSTLSAVANWVDTEESNALSRYFTLKNSVQPGVMLKVDDEAQAPSEPDIERISHKFLNRYGSETKAGTPIILNGLTLMPPPSMPSEMQYLQSEDQLRDMVLAAFGVTKVAVGLLDEVNRAAFLAGMMQFSVNGVNPRLSYFSQVMTQKLATKFNEPEDYELVAYFEDSTPNDPDVINARCESMARTNAITGNEIRNEQGFEPFTESQNPYGDQVLIPANLVPSGLSLTHEDITIDAGEGAPAGGGDTGQAQTNALLETVGGIDGTVGVLEKYNSGLLTREQARGLLVLFFKLDPATVNRLIPDDIPPAIAARLANDLPTGNGQPADGH